MRQKIYQIDAFADKVFSGNPAAVCPLQTWLSEEIMQKIAMENNLAETAFYVKKDDFYEIRWFTPLVEVDLCGHATLAAAYVLFYCENHVGSEISFYSARSGNLKVTKNEDLLTLDFPVDVFSEVAFSEELLACFNEKPLAIYKGKTDYLYIFEDENQLKNIEIHFDKIAKIAARGLIVSAKGNEVDFVSRFFAPQCGINEDPVTGSAHTTLTPYWAKKLGKNTLTAKQLSTRGGTLKCQFLQERVAISGQAKLYLVGEIYWD